MEVCLVSHIRQAHLRQVTLEMDLYLITVHLALDLLYLVEGISLMITMVVKRQYMKLVTILIFFTHGVTHPMQEVILLVH